MSVVAVDMATWSVICFQRHPSVSIISLSHIHFLEVRVSVASFEMLADPIFLIIIYSDLPVLYVGNKINFQFGRGSYIPNKTLEKRLRALDRIRA